MSGSFQKACVVALSAVFGLCSPVVAATVYVDADAMGANNGTSWCDAYLSLQDALQGLDAGSDHEVRVAGGVYTPAPAGGSRITSFQLRNGVALLGGYAGCGSPNPDANDSSLYETVLSGDLNGDDNIPLFTDNSYHIVTGDGVDSTAVLQGFTISGAFADGSNPSDRGGGIFLFPNESSPVIRDCRFENNTVLAKGAAIYAFRGFATVEGCVFENNSATDGGAVYNLQGAMSYRRCSFRNNQASGLGGAMFHFSSSSLVSDCVFSSNAAVGGGAVQFVDSPTTMQNCQFFANVASGQGLPSGGAILSQDSTPSILNGLFVGNSADQAGGAVHSLLGSETTIRNSTFVYNEAGSGGAVGNSSSATELFSCILWANQDQQGGDSDQIVVFSGDMMVSHSCVQSLPDTFVGNGNIGDDPLFGDTLGQDGQPASGDEDYSLLPQSPCIDSGQPASADQLPATDLMGNDRQSCREVDMGAFEFPDPPSCLTVSVPTVGAWGLAILGLLILTVARLSIRRMPAGAR
ncbi:MAG: right-handed parallel beta-helix repeat-containing protein [Phycisphaerae bacterium]